MDEWIENSYTKIAIPKDPESDSAIFLTGLPYCLQRLIGADEWKHIIQNLNKIILEKDAPTFINALKFILGFPLLFDTSSYDLLVDKYLRSVNSELSTRKIFICHPMFNGYTELEVRYQNIVECVNETV
ncbi:hypothetical protein PAEPH01_1874 [Pancytospora epiphaga]|nr:hypothetical protein PAEPH01_1874 [Pancytospora epiphaga]